MSDKDKKLLAKIRKHLFDLHTEWANSDKDGGHKSNEGYVGVFLYYPNWFEANDYLNDLPEAHCEVYSYLFGPHRLHQFRSLEEAWEAVKNWSNHSE